MKEKDIRNTVNSTHRRKRGLRLLLYIFVLLFLFVVAGGIWFWITLNKPVGKISETEYVYIRPETSFDELKKSINDKIILRHPRIFSLLAKRLELPLYMKTGRYAIEPDMTVMQLINTLRSGRQAPLKITINNIRTQEQLVSRLSEKLMFDSVQLATLLADSRYCDSLGFTTETVRTLFIPDTYEFFWDVTPRQLISTMKKYYSRFWSAGRLEKAQSIGLTPLEIITIASIVEEESAKQDEHARIAGLYVNRLKKGMKLQADPTVKYALADFTLTRILHEHLQTPSPYNTYYNVGLPPAPIRLPQKSTIDKVLDYERHEYLFMCAKEDFSGYHNFAATFAQHRVNAVKYQQELNRRKIK
ncbi:aminodeoxychorismate lyase [Porphyromonas macacae]|uniref:endolytic transglycosylase MltG n=1 Tax=Porphyromonas macacae TaxID=28115 RepID=UPI00052E1828|nr:endolytic transglycosylase MltG [Porphyromonas macacae]KGN98541.1 aminodeoxychorismate lyase [Porphyromonas macacae]